jgi:hypothetical protein
MASLVPLDDAVVFPGMPVTIPAISATTAGCCDPRRGVGCARVGVSSGRKRHTIRGTDVMSLDALFRRPRHRPGDQDGVLRVEVDEHPDARGGPPISSAIRAWSRRSSNARR